MCERYIDWLPLAHPQLGTWPITQVCALTRTRTNDLSICRPALSPLNHTSWGLIIFDSLQLNQFHFYFYFTNVNMNEMFLCIFYNKL